MADNEQFLIIPAPNKTWREHLHVETHLLMLIASLEREMKRLKERHGT